MIELDTKNQEAAVFPEISYKTTEDHQVKKKYICRMEFLVSFYNAFNTP